MLRRRRTLSTGVVANAPDRAKAVNSMPML
jgi:hypothetical protein